MYKRQVYDSLNELKEEYDYVNKFYINYSYDGAGNLQNKYEQVLDPTYGYPTGTQNGNTYEYTDTSWKDKLTKVNGSNISYDEGFAAAASRIIWTVTEFNSTGVSNAFTS